jgi:iron-sulfur cluster assembly accessory protein
MTLILTEAARTFVRRLLRFPGAPGQGLRLAITPHGCSGLGATFSVEPGPAAEEQVFDFEGGRLFLNADGIRLLEGVTVDFADTMLQTGFIFHNPRAVSCSRAPTLPPLPSRAPAGAA